MSDNATTAPAEKAPSTFTSLDIDPEGDVYLCSDDFKLLVSSKALSLASPVFKKLFGPHFIEGSQISAKKPGSTTLSEDNAEAMVALCQIIHHQPFKAAYDPPLRFMDTLAIIADKYDCVPALAPWSASWLHVKLRLEPSGLEVGRLLFSAFLFNDPVIFQQVTKSMVYSLPTSEYKSLRSLWSEEIGPKAEDMLPEGLISMDSTAPNLEP